MRFEPGASSDARRAARRTAAVDFGSTVGLPHVQVVDVEGSIQAAVRRLERQPGVAYAQPNYRYEATAVEPPTDKFFDELWGLSNPVLPDPGVGALDAWGFGFGEGQVIAVLDTGVDLTHPDVTDNLWENPGELIDGFDDDLNGKVDDIHGYDFVDEDGDPDDYHFHGTHVAGTAAAAFNNGEEGEEGIAGVAPAAEIMAVRVLDGDGSGLTSDIAAGIAYAAEEGADAINLSLGGPAGVSDELTEDAIELAGTEGAVVVAAAGNEGVDNDEDPHSPCVLPQANLICVAALNKGGSLASFSNWGAESVDLAAPGTTILSTKVDYKAVLSDGFDNAELAGWEKFTESGVPWGGTDAVFFEGTHSAADSPGAGEKYAPNSNTQLIKDISEPTDLTIERGCRSHFDLRRDIQPSDGSEFTDVLAAGAIAELSEMQALLGFAGSSGGQFRRTQVSISALDGEADVFHAFALFSDSSDQRDGAYVDDLEVLCRDTSSYVNEIAPSPPGKYDEPTSGNYVNFNGTSMATPHVAGVVALVGAAVDDAELELTPEQIVEAVLEGTSAMPGPDPERPTATFGIADACKAIAVVTEQNFEEVCLASSVPEEPEPPEEEDEPTSSDDFSDAGVPPPAVPPPPIVTPDSIAPHTFIKERPRKVVFTPWRRGRAVFKFRSNEAGVLFFCQFDRKRWRRCGPRFVRWFLPGPHVLRVKARDAAGNVDPRPAVYRFRVRRVSKQQFARLKRASRRARQDRG